MAKERRVLLPVGIVALGVLALLGVINFYKTQIHTAQPTTLISSHPLPAALVDLQPEPAEESLKPINFRERKQAIVSESKRFSACVDAAANVDEGVWCMGQLLSMMPRPLEKRALEVAKEVYPSKRVVVDPKVLSLKLESCLEHAEERDGAVFCVSDLLAHVPPAVLNKAVELGEAHPAFDWPSEKPTAVHEAAVFNACVDTAANIEEGVGCLGTFFTELPEAMVERSVRIQTEVPAPHSPAEEPQMLAKDFVYCLEIAESRDAATYCLAHFLGRLPDEQVHEAYQYNKLHRGRGEPFLTEFQKEDEVLIQHLEDQKVESGENPTLPGLGFGVGAREQGLTPTRALSDNAGLGHALGGGVGGAPRHYHTAAAAGTLRRASKGSLEHEWLQWRKKENKKESKKGALNGEAQRRMAAEYAYAKHAVAESEEEQRLALKKTASAASLKRRAATLKRLIERRLAHAGAEKERKEP